VGILLAATGLFMSILYYDYLYSYSLNCVKFFLFFLKFSIIPVLIALLRSVIELSIVVYNGGDKKVPIKVGELGAIVSIWRTQKNADKGRALGAIIVGGLFILIGVFSLIRDFL
jgi:hypothetical protein